MKIAINLFGFSKSKVNGIKKVATNLILHILKSTKKEQFFLLGEKDLDPVLKVPYENVKLILIPLPSFLKKPSIQRVIFKQIYFLFLRFCYKIDIFFTPSLGGPLFCKNSIEIIHDCSTFPKDFENNFLRKLYHNFLISNAKYFDRKIITVSNFSKKELIEKFKVNPQKIEIIYPGVPSIPKIDRKFIQNTLKKFKINKPYFYTIGNESSRKNIQNIVGAFELVKKYGLDYYLVITGIKNKNFLKTREKVRKAIILTGKISEKEKYSLYKRAQVFLFPSFYEGFGMPILEAQSVGIPVLTSTTSVLPEVAGKGALFCNPHDIREIAQGMERLANDENLRRELIIKGYDNIKRFSWERSAQKLIKFFSFKIGK